MTFRDCSTSPLSSRSRLATLIAKAFSEIVSNLLAIVASRPACSTAETASRWRSRQRRAR